MAEPVTTNKFFIVPNTGDLPAAWGTSALNPNFQTIDALTGGMTTISLSVATTILLSVPAANGVWPSSLSQSVNALIKFTGTQSGNAVIQFTLPGYYIIENRCTGTSFFVQLSPSVGVGKSVGAPPGKKCHVFYDGTDMDYVNMPDPGTAYDFHTNTTALPPWMLACTVAPYLLKDGTSYSVATYPALASYLGSTYGGDGAVSFCVPDERARMRIPVDTAVAGATSARVTNAISGVSGATLGAAGGDQRMQSHNHGITDAGHSHAAHANAPNNSGAGGGSALAPSNPMIPGASTSYGTTDIATTSITINSAGTGSSQNMPPTIVNFLALVKTVLLAGVIAGSLYMTPSQTLANPVNGAVATFELSG